MLQLNFNDYTWTKHADERLMQRFLIAKTGRQSFLTNFFTSGGKFERKDGNTDIWTNGEISVVVNPESRTIITVYHKYNTSENEGINEDLQIDLAVEAKKLKKRVVRSSVEEIETYLSDANRYLRSLSNTHDEVINENFESLYSTIVSLKKYLGKIKAYREDADKVIEK